LPFAGPAWMSPKAEDPDNPHLVEHGDYPIRGTAGAAAFPGTHHHQGQEEQVFHLKS
jgi:hypothetical protein